MQAAVSEGCSQADSWLIEIILKVGWDWTKQSKSLFKPTQICLYLWIECLRISGFSHIDWCFKYSCFQCSNAVCCQYWFCVFSMVLQHKPILQHGWRDHEGSVLLVQSQLHKVTWEWQPDPGQGSVHSPTSFQQKLVHEAEEGGEMLSCCQNTELAPPLQSLYTFAHPEISSNREMKLNWEWSRREPGWGQAQGRSSFDVRGLMAAAAPEAGRSGSCLHPHLPELCPVPSCPCISIISSCTNTASNSKLIP